MASPIPPALSRQSQPGQRIDGNGLQPHSDVRRGIRSAFEPSAAVETLAPQGPRIVATGERSEPVEASSLPLEPRKGRRRSLLSNPPAGAAFRRPCRGGAVKTTFHGFRCAHPWLQPWAPTGPVPQAGPPRRGLAHCAAGWLSVFGLGGGRSLGCVGQIMQLCLVVAAGCNQPGNALSSGTSSASAVSPCTSSRMTFSVTSRR